MKPNIIAQLAKALDDIEAIAPDDEGVRHLPPGTLDKARRLIKKADALAPAMDALVDAAQCVHVDCEMALCDDWDRNGNDGFEAMMDNIAKALRGMGVKPKHHATS